MTLPEERPSAKKGIVVNWRMVIFLFALVDIALIYIQPSPNNCYSYQPIVEGIFFIILTGFVFGLLISLFFGIHPAINYGLILILGLIAAILVFRLVSIIYPSPPTETFSGFCKFCLSAPSKITLYPGEAPYPGPFLCVSENHLLIFLINVLLVFLAVLAGVGSIAFGSLVRYLIGTISGTYGNNHFK